MPFTNRKLGFEDLTNPKAIEQSVNSDPLSFRTEYQVANINKFRHDNINIERKFKQYMHRGPEEILSRNPHFIN